MKYYIYPIIVTLIFTSCSQVFEPTLKNSYSTPLTIYITYEDNSKRKIVIFNKCTHIGRSEEDKNKIKKIDFSIENKIVHSLDKEKIRQLLVEVNRPKYKRVAWVISKKGIEIQECTKF